MLWNFSKSLQTLWTINFSHHSKCSSPCSRIHQTFITRSRLSSTSVPGSRVKSWIINKGEIFNFSSFFLHFSSRLVDFFRLQQMYFMFLSFSEVLTFKMYIKAKKEKGGSGKTMSNPFHCYTIVDVRFMCLRCAVKERQEFLGEQKNERKVVTFMVWKILTCSPKQSRMMDELCALVLFAFSQSFLRSRSYQSPHARVKCEIRKAFKLFSKLSLLKKVILMAHLINHCFSATLVRASFSSFLVLYVASLEKNNYHIKQWKE